MNSKNVFLLLLCLVFFCSKAQIKVIPDSISLSDARFFSNKPWHDSLFPVTGFASAQTLKAGMNFARRTNDTPLQAYAGVRYARVMLSEKKYTEAFEALHRTLLLDTLLPPLSAVRQFLYTEASVFYSDFGTYKIAKKYLWKALDISRKRETMPTVRLFSYYSNYAGLAQRIGYKDSCYFYYLKSIEAGKKIDLQFEASGLNNFGMLLLKDSKTDSSLKTFLLAKSKIVQYPRYDTSFYYSINDNLGDVYASQGQYGRALPFYNSKFDYNIMRRNRVQIFNAGIKSTSMMIKLGDISGARKRIRLLDSLCVKNGPRLGYDKRESFLRLQLELAEYTGNLREMSTLSRKLLQLKDEVIADAQNDRLSKLESLLLENSDRFAKEIEIEKLKLEESTARAQFNKILAAGAIIAALLIISILILLYRRRIAQNRFAFEQETIKRQLAESTLQNEQLAKIRLKQQLELNKVAIEQESYKRELAEINLKNETLEKTQISQQLELKKRDVTDYALAYSQRKKIFEEVITRIREIKRSQNPAERLQELGKSLKKQLHGHTEMEIDTGGIEKVNHEFFEKLNQVCPDLTPGEKDLTGLIRLNFSSKEISSLRNISPSSVRMSKFRLKKKLGLDPEENLVEFIRKV